MDSACWQKMQDIFHEAVDLPADRQVAFLNTACGDDDALRKSVEAMLREDDSLLDHDLANVAHDLLSDAIPLKNFGHYRILKLLGQGGMGVVYLAEREDLGSLVAIKVLRDAWLHPSRREHDPPKPSVIVRKNSSANSSSGQFRKAEWPELDVLCLTAMHKDPERRYRSVEALIRDIDHYRDGEPLEARPDSFHYRARKFV